MAYFLCCNSALIADGGLIHCQLRRRGDETTREQELLIGDSFCQHFLQMRSNKNIISGDAGRTVDGLYVARKPHYKARLRLYLY